MIPAAKPALSCVMSGWPTFTHELLCELRLPKCGPAAANNIRQYSARDAGIFTYRIYRSRLDCSTKIVASRPRRIRPSRLYKRPGKFCLPAEVHFEAFKARPAAEELPHGIRGTGSPYFRKAPRLQPPYDSDASVRTLSSVNDPALRCAALWWAHVLLAESHPCCNPRRLGPPSRQWSLLQSRCPTGLHWPIERMRRWPREYVRR
jgi:hypothetical protein